MHVIFKPLQIQKTTFYFQYANSNTKTTASLSILDPFKKDFHRIHFKGAQVNHFVVKAATVTPTGVPG